MPEHRQTPLRTFSSGTHTLTIEARDDTGQLTRFVWVLAVVPVPDYSVQMPLLLVDDVPDRSSNAWLAADGVSPLDNDIFRDAFWREMLTGHGGVQGFDPLQDVVDLEDEEFGLRRLVNYRAAIWTSRYAQNNFVWNNFKPFNDFSMRYIWLASYQRFAGNLFLVGSKVLLQFLPGGSWLMPVVFDTDEGGPGSIGGPPGYIGYAGLGTVELPDGTIVNAGTLLYPYQDLGVSILDVMDPRGHFIDGCTGTPWSARCRRLSACSGTKALVRDSAFALAHPTFAAGVAESIFTDDRIDWRDQDPAHHDALDTWIWGDTEFYDRNISGRTTPWVPQDCDGQPCLEPMFLSLSRYDWVADLHAAAGDPDWPGSRFTWRELQDICGGRTLSPITNRSLTSGLPVGFLSHKLVADKPSRRADVVWGFDPYRFDHAAVRGAIQWVLGEHFGLVMQP